MSRNSNTRLSLQNRGTLSPFSTTRTPYPTNPNTCKYQNNSFIHSTHSPSRPPDCQYCSRPSPSTFNWRNNISSANRQYSNSPHYIILVLLSFLPTPRPPGTPGPTALPKLRLAFNNFRTKPGDTRMPLPTLLSPPCSITCT